MIAKNTELIRRSGAKTLVTSCPICYRVFRQQYDLKGIEVLHHSQYIDRLIQDGRITVKYSRCGLRTTTVRLAVGAECTGNPDG